MLPVHKSLALLPRWPRGDRRHSPPAARPAWPARRYFWLGACLALAFLAQQAGGWRWPLLTALQGDNLYKQATGFGLLAFIAYQWRFSWLRAQGDAHQAALLSKRHKLFGAFAPLLLVAHSQSLGFGYLQILCLVFLLVFLTGLCNFEIVKIRKPWFHPLWVSVHVGLSTALLLLLGYHVYLSYAFK